jgi:hypothetical protein
LGVLFEYLKKHGTTTNHKKGIQLTEYALQEASDYLFTGGYAYTLLISGQNIYVHVFK